MNTLFSQPSIVSKVLGVVTVLATLAALSGVTAVAPANAQVIMDGALVKTADNPDVYVIKIEGTKIFKRLILNPQIFNSYGHLRWENIQIVPQVVLNSYTNSQLIIEVNPDGAPVTGRVFQISSSPGADMGIKRWLNMTPAQFEAAGFDWDAIYQVNHLEAAETFYPSGTPITAGNVDDGDGTPGVEGNLRAELRATPAAVSVEEGDNDVAVAGFEVEAEMSDITVQRVDVRFEVTAGDDRPWIYLDEVALRVDGTVVAREQISSSDDFTEVSTDVHELRFSGLNVNLDADTVSMMEVLVDGSDVIDSADLPGTIEVSIPTNGIRGVDGAGIQQHAPTSTIGRPFTVEQDAGGDLNVSLAATSSEERIAVASTDGATDDIEVLSFEVETENDAVTIDDVTVDFTTSVGDETDDVFTTVHLFMGSTLIASENVPVNDADNVVSITFDTLNRELNANQTTAFRVLVDVPTIGTATFPEGATIQATVGVGDITGEADNGDDVTSTGSATGSDVHLFSVAPELDLVSTSFVITPDSGGDEADATIVVDITARGGDVFIAQAGDAEEIQVVGTGAAAGDVTYTYTSNAPTSANDTYRIAESTTRRVTLSAHVTNDELTGGFGTVALDSVIWDIVADAVLDFGTVDFGLEDFRTSSIFLQAAN